MIGKTALASAMMLWAGAAVTQEAPAVDCSRVRVALPKALAGWQAGQPLIAGTQVGLAPILPLGKGSLAALKPGDGVTYVRPPEKAGAAGSFGGLFTFAAPRAGRYRVALGAGAWIDVVNRGASVASVGHGHGPQCTGVRKMVDFNLPAGPSVIQLAGSPQDSVQIMVVRIK